MEDRPVADQEPAGDRVEEEEADPGQQRRKVHPADPVSFSLKWSRLILAFACLKKSQHVKETLKFVFLQGCNKTLKPRKT